MEELGRTILHRVSAAFVTKSRGGTDEAGDRWEPLSPKTVAYGRGDRTKGSSSDRPSQALTAAQRVRWWQVYRQQKARFGGDKGRAARFAWTVVKGMGAVTLFDKYSKRHVEILRDTGGLLDSLTPGKSSACSVFRTYPGEVVVGTVRVGAAAHHAGVPGRLPQRRLWPEPKKWPGSWWRDLQLVAVRGALDVAVSLVRS